MLSGFPVFFRGNRHSHSRDPLPLGIAPHLRPLPPPALPGFTGNMASPPPSLARPDPRGLSVGACHATSWASRVASIPLFHACCRQYPRRNLSVHASLASQQVSAFPVIRAGRLPHYAFRGLLGDSLRVTARMVAKPPWRPVTSECFRRCRYLHHPLRLLPAGTTVAGRDSHPLKNGAFHGAPDKRLYVNFSGG